MLITGKWQVGDDGVLRPLVRAAVSGIDGRLVADDFLIDSGADHTVLSAALLARLSLPTRSAPSRSTLSGIGGGCAFVLLTSAVEFIREDGGASTGPRGVCWCYRSHSDGFEHPRARCAGQLRPDPQLVPQ